MFWLYMVDFISRFLCDPPSPGTWERGYVVPKLNNSPRPPSHAFEAQTSEVYHECNKLERNTHVMKALQKVAKLRFQKNITWTRLESELLLDVIVPLVGRHARTALVFNSCGVTITRTATVLSNATSCYRVSFYKKRPPRIRPTRYSHQSSSVKTHRHMR